MGDSHDHDDLEYFEQMMPRRHPLGIDFRSLRELAYERRGEDDDQD